MNEIKVEVELLLKLAGERYVKNDLDGTIKIYKQILQQEQSLDPFKCFEVYRKMGGVFNLQKKRPEAIEANNKAISYFDEIIFDEEALAEWIEQKVFLLDSLLHLYIEIKDYPRALESIEQIRKIQYQYHDDYDVIGENNLDMARVYKLVGDYPISLEHYNKTIEIIERRKKNSKLECIGMYLGMIYCEKGEILFYLKNFNGALFWLQKGIDAFLYEYIPEFEEDKDFIRMRKLLERIRLNLN